LDERRGSGSGSGRRGVVLRMVGGGGGKVVWVVWGVLFLSGMVGEGRGKLEV